MILIAQLLRVLSLIQGSHIPRNGTYLNILLIKVSKGVIARCLTRLFGLIIPWWELC